MGLLIGVIAFVALGLGAVVWLFLKDKDSISSSIEKLEPDQITGEMVNEPETSNFSDGSDPFENIPKKAEKKGFLRKFGHKDKKGNGHLPPDILDKEEKPSSSIVGKLLGKLKFGKKDDLEDDIPQATPFPDLKSEPSTLSDQSELSPEDQLKESVSQQKTNPLNQAATPEKEVSEEPPVIPPENEPAPKPEFSPGEPLSESEQIELDKEIENSIEESSLKKRYDNLDKLFTEKSAELQRVSAALENEQKNRKDFNKLKDILEKEIKELKDDAKKTETEYESGKEEILNYKQRVNQLEDKITQLEKEIISKEQEIEEIKNRPAESNNANDSAGTSEPPESAPDKPEEPPVDKEDETPSADKEDEAPPVDKEDETPSADKEDEAPPVDKEDETPSADKEDETPPVDKEDETPPAETEKTNEKKIDEISPSEPPELPTLEIIDPSETKTISPIPKKSPSEPKIFQPEVPEGGISFEGDERNSSSPSEESDEPKQNSIADEIEASIKVDDQNGDENNDAPQNASEEEIKPISYSDDTEPQLHLIPDETPPDPDDDKSEEEKMSELQNKLNAIESEEQEISEDKDEDQENTEDDDSHEEKTDNDNEERKES